MMCSEVPLYGHIAVVSRPKVLELGVLSRSAASDGGAHSSSFNIVGLETESSKQATTNLVVLKSETGTPLFYTIYLCGVCPAT